MYGVCMAKILQTVWAAKILHFQYKPKNQPFINEVKEALDLLRTTGAQWIHERKTAINNGDDVPKDILTQIIKTAGKGYAP